MDTFLCLKLKHFSFDIDVLDPSEAPATGTRVRGGLTLRSEVLTIPAFVFIAKVCFAQCSTSRLALGSPGWSVVRHHAQYLKKTL